MKIFFVYSKKFVIFDENTDMKIFAVKNGIRYFKKQLESTEKNDKKEYYRNEIYRLERKLYVLEVEQEIDNDEIIQEREETN